MNYNFEITHFYFLEQNCNINKGRGAKALHTYRHTDRQTYIQTDRHKDRQTYRPPDEAFAPKKM